jgi:hypothetical protein
VHYITGVGNLAVNAGLALVCRPALADALVTRRLLASGQATW